MTEEDKINDAIVNYLSILWTDQSRQNIENLFGSELYLRVNSIAADGVNDVIWASGDDLIAHTKTMNILKNKYPFLSNASLIKLADCAAYFWKTDE